MSGPRAGTGGPRGAPPRRGGSGRRGHRQARNPPRATSGRRPAPGSRRPSAAELDQRIESEGQADTQGDPASDRRGLSGLALLLDDLDRLLRDPTLARALSAFATRVAGAMRGLVAAIGDAARALPRLRLPRRLLLGLLALTLPLALLALLSSRDDGPSGGAADQPAARSSAPAADGLASVGAGMPRLAGAPEKVRPVSVALVLDGTYAGAERARELGALGNWLADNHAPGTRVSVIDATTGRASTALRPQDLGRARLTREPASTPAAIRSAFSDPDRRRLLVTLGTRAPSSGASTLSIATRRGAAPAGVVNGERRRSRATIDDRRPNALAASVARAIMGISGQTERR